MNDIKTTVHYDETTDKTGIYREQDCEPIVQEVSDLKQVTDGRGNTSMGYFAGRIPGIIVEQYMREVGINFQTFIKDEIHIQRIMNNPDYKKFRVFEGKI